GWNGGQERRRRSKSEEVRSASLFEHVVGAFDGLCFRPEVLLHLVAQVRHLILVVLQPGLPIRAADLSQACVARNSEDGVRIERLFAHPRSGRAMTPSTILFFCLSPPRVLFPATYGFFR